MVCEDVGCEGVYVVRVLLPESAKPMAFGVALQTVDDDLRIVAPPPALPFPAKTHPLLRRSCQ